MCCSSKYVFISCLLLQSPRASPSLQGEYSLVLFTQHDQRPSAAASGMISFGGSDDDMDDSLSQVASDTEELSGSLTDPGILPPSSSCNARPRGDEELASWPAHSYQMEGEGESSVQAMQSHFCTRWTRILGSWTSGFGAALYGCGPGLPGQDARQWGGRPWCSFTQKPEERNRPGPTCHQNHRPGHRAVDVLPGSVGTPPLAHDDGDERVGHSSLP